VIVLRESGPGWPNGPPSRRLAPGGFYASTRTEYGLALSFGGCERVLGGLVVIVLRESGPGWPNGPPSRRLAPGGFY
jgi:hypothetical protein